MNSTTPAVSVLPPVPRPLVEKANALYIYLMHSSDSLGEKVQAVYRYTDEFSQFISQYMSCGRGCSYCCSIDVQITTLEAHYIQERTGISAHGGISITTGHRDPCPFVTTDGSCSVYSVRPLVCRIFHATGAPTNCRPGETQMQYGHPPSFGNDIYANLVRWTHHVTNESGGTLRDIRDFFPAGVLR